MQTPPKRQQRTELLEKLYLGRLRMERRNGSPFIYMRTHLQGKPKGKSTGEETLGAAVKVATKWYLDLVGRADRGESIHGKTFAECAEAFLEHAARERLAGDGQRKNYADKWNLLKNFKVEDEPKVKGQPKVLVQPTLGEAEVAAVNDSKYLSRLRAARAECTNKQGKRVSNATLKKDLDFLRLVLKHAKFWMKCLDAELADFPNFKGREWAVVDNPRPFLDYQQYVKVRALAKSRAEEAGLNPRTRRQRQELYCMILMCVGAALRISEVRSLRWMDCTPGQLNNGTDCVMMRVFGKHAKYAEHTGKREDAYALYDGVIGYNFLKSLRPDAKPDDPLFLEKHTDGMRELLEEAGLRFNDDMTSRDSNSLRQTGISMRLDLGPSPDYRDIAKWARTHPMEIARFYDQTHPHDSVERIAGFRPRPEKPPKDEAERLRMEKAERDLAAMREAAKLESELSEYERGQDDADENG
jgi:hypothetical protein